MSKLLTGFMTCRGDEQGDSAAGVLHEARRAYAAGLLDISLADNETCEETVRSGIISQLAHYLRRAVLVPPTPTSCSASSPTSAAPADASPTASNNHGIQIIEESQEIQLTPDVDGMDYIPAVVSAQCVHRTTQGSLMQLRGRCQGAEERKTSPRNVQVETDRLLVEAMELEDALESAACAPQSPSRSIPQQCLN